MCAHVWQLVDRQGELVNVEDLLEGQFVKVIIGSRWVFSSVLLEYAAQR